MDMVTVRKVNVTVTLVTQAGTVYRIPALSCAAVMECTFVVTVNATRAGKVVSVKSARTSARSPTVMAMEDVLMGNVSVSQVSRAQTVE